MMKKKILSLCMVAIMLNLSVETYAYSLNNIQLATSSDLTNNPSGGDTPSGDGGAEQPPIHHQTVMEVMVEIQLSLQVVAEVVQDLEELGVQQQLQALLLKTKEAIM